MNESAAPWRALEDEAVAANGAANGAAPSSALGEGVTGPMRPPWVLIALAVAAAAAGVAFWLVVAGGTGTVVVEGGAPAPGRSGAGAGLAMPGAASPSAAPLIIDVQGAVIRPGIVRLPPGSRVADAISAAGGYGPRVATNRIGQSLNLAALLKDGGQIVVPSRDDPGTTTAPGGTGAGGGSGGGGSGGGGSGGAGPIDLNRATATELDALPGIGPVTAAKIIAAREEQAFVSVDDLKTRKILGAATFDKVKDLVVVR